MDGITYGAKGLTLDKESKIEHFFVKRDVARYNRQNGFCIFSLGGFGKLENNSELWAVSAAEGNRNKASRRNAFPKLGGNVIVVDPVNAKRSIQQIHARVSLSHVGSSFFVI